MAAGDRNESPVERQERLARHHSPVVAQARNPPRKRPRKLALMNVLLAGNAAFTNKLVERQLDFW